MQLIAEYGQPIDYNTLIVTDAKGRRLPAEFKVAEDNGFSIIIDDIDAHYPLTVDPIIRSSFDSMWTGTQQNEVLGFAMSSAGDFNGDGFNDILVGVPYHDTGTQNSGRVFLHLGGLSGVESTPAYLFDGNGASLKFGSSIAGGGDIDGDGYGDIVIGAPNYSNGETNEGAAYIYHGSASGISLKTSVLLESNIAGASFGKVAAAGDVNGGGYDDFLLGGSFDKIKLYYGNSAGHSMDNVTLQSDKPGSSFGFTGSGAGDVNGDGFADILFGAQQ